MKIPKIIIFEKRKKLNLYSYSDKDIEDLRQPSNLTIEDVKILRQFAHNIQNNMRLTRELKREQILNYNKNVVKVDNFFEIDAIDTKNLSETEQAFDLVYDPLHNVLNDNEAQIWKTNQPIMKLMAPKEQKTTSVNPLSTQYILEGKVVGQSIFANSANNPTKNSNIIMQSHLTYQLSSNIKNLMFDIKDPIILSTNNVEKYCKCQKLYEGELMIKCSNDNCNIIWYHPACVGIKNTNPKELEEIVFTCDDCNADKNAKKQTAGQTNGDKPLRKKAVKN